MNVFDSPDFDHHEQVAFFDDKATGLKAIISVHSTAMGPACGGTRMYAYATADDALTDVLRLSRGMSYKNAIADLPLGGGKAVILGDPAKDKNDSRLLAFADAVNSFGGRYITAVDSGTTIADMVVLARRTRHVVGHEAPAALGNDPSPWTARGVLAGIRTAVNIRFGDRDLKGKRIAIQGVGHVGEPLARFAAAEGAHLILADADEARVNRLAGILQGEVVPSDGILEADADVIAPCAFGGVLTLRNVQRIKAPIVAGAANNQLATDEVASALKARGILYLPDYVINSGGIMHVYAIQSSLGVAWLTSQVESIRTRLEEILRAAETDGVNTVEAANNLAERLLAAARSKRSVAAE